MAYRQNILDVGECILVDSTRPTTFYFGGRFSNHLSLHLPRQLMYSDSRIPFDIARKLSAHDPMAHMLHALIAKIMATTESDSASQHLRQLMFNATRQAFHSTGESAPLHSLHDSASKRLQIVDLLIDRHLTETELPHAGLQPGSVFPSARCNRIFKAWALPAPWSYATSGCDWRREKSSS